VAHVRLAVAASDAESVPERPDLVRVALRPLAADSVLFALTPPDEREAYKWSLIPGEVPCADPGTLWPLDWASAEHAVSRDLVRVAVYASSRRAPSSNGWRTPTLQLQVDDLQVSVISRMHGRHATWVR